MIKLFTLALMLVLVGCSSTSIIPGMSSMPDGAVTAVSGSNACSPMLGWIGGLCLLAGMAMLVITSGIVTTRGTLRTPTSGYYLRHLHLQLTNHLHKFSPHPVP